MARCRLDGPDREVPDSLRFVPLSEFDLWRHLMETRHGRRVLLESVSVWMPEGPDLAEHSLDVEDLEPVVRMRFERSGPLGSAVPVERFFPAETYPLARAALLSHLPAGQPVSAVHVSPGYFVTRSAWESRQTLAPAG